MLANQVYTALESISQGSVRSLDRDTSQFLQESDLTSVLSFSDYRGRKLDISRLRSVERNIDECQVEVTDYEGQRDTLSEKLGSKLHKFWSRESTLASEQRELDDAKSRLQQSSQSLSDSKAEKQRLEELKQDTEGYVRTSDEYVKLSSYGSSRSRQLAARVARLGDVSYADANEEIEQVYAALQNRYDEFKDMYEFLVGKGFSRDSKVVQYALVLSSLGLEQEEAYERAGVVNGHLRSKKWGSYDRLRIASAVAAQEGDITELRDELVEIFMALHNGGAAKSYALWNDAANIMKLQGASRDDRITRYNEFGQALFEENWDPNSDVPTSVRANSRGVARSRARSYQWNAMSRITAANLALLDISPEDAAPHWSEIEERMIEGGRTDCLESGIAAMILTGATSTAEKKAHRFNEAFDTMHQYGWEKDVSFYPAAAVVSLMPGTIEENVQLLDDVTEMMKIGGFKYQLTDRAIQIVSGSYQGLVRSGSIPTFVTASSHASSAIGFNIDWAVTADLFVHRRPSSGLFGGGPFGGCFGLSSSKR